MVTEEIKQRKGARKQQDIPEEVLMLLNSGKIETVNLTEWLAVDHVRLISNVFPELKISEAIEEAIIGVISEEKKRSTMNVIQLIGTQLFACYKKDQKFSVLIEVFSKHLSDSVRCYVPYLLALDESLSVEEKLEKSKHLAADHHFGVREVVWMALRPEIEKELELAISFLSSWSKNKDENIRRFATEVIRPRGVWCKHIQQLKETPELALPILEPLKADPSRYVQNSVGNWLNDASKSRPDFVIELCERWEKESPVSSTQYIIKRAKRTIVKTKKK
ncbi:MAG: DNA alkylation repair protein [Flavobacteriales bacterium]|jgi:3-methyladenine DNA glycosylase AlkC|nr:DNA alkylation repair protein [Flavobacteriales bacterium]